MILRALKHATLGAARKAGLFDRVRDSRWRRSRLLILCYHGVSLDDEHLGSDYYVSPEHLRSRLELLRNARFNVLPLADAVLRLYAGTLPPRSVALTFDDGLFDFYARAYPLLKEFGVHGTVYVTTYHTAVQLPVCDSVMSYLLWKGRGRVLDTSGLAADSRTVVIPEDQRARIALQDEISELVLKRGLSVEEKDKLVRYTCQQIGVDYEELCTRRQSHLMTADELRSLSPAHVDVQLHTHRHRTPRDEALFLREIEDNRAALTQIGRDAPGLVHFCYPNGDYAPEFLDWLRESGVQSATTCDPGLASRSSDPLLLPRLIDTMNTSEDVMLGWLSGVAALMPQRRHTAWMALDRQLPR